MNPNDFDLSAMTDGELTSLADELRREILTVTSQNGGHLASNLGMVEATLALHRTFRLPHDKLIFDVGHQAYAHKLLTGRRDRFSTLRQSGGLSGFTNRDESPFDTTTAGHSGTALSTAIGMAEANRITGSDAWVVAIVGDGSFTNGMVYEALNQLAGRPIRLILLLNDNGMSISKNVGGLSRYLSVVRTSEKYFTFKMRAKRFFSAIPLIGNGLVGTARRIRDFLKRITNSVTFFENLGLEYIGPVDGNDLHRLTAVLEEAKAKNCPVIVHMKTKKGLGYPPAQAHPERYHSTGPFPLTPEAQSAPAKKAPTFTEEVSTILSQAGEENPTICAITAAMTDGCGLSEFAARFPDRFFDVGIAEEHAATLVGGLALGGMRPVLVLYATFAQRIFDQLWHDVSLQRARGILLLSHAGIVPGDGITHQGIYDVPLLARLPGVRIDSPHDFAALRRSFREAAESDGLCVIRYPKGGEAVLATAGVVTRHGNWEQRTYGSGVVGLVILTYGRIAQNVTKAAARMAQESGTAVVVAVLCTIAPLPDDPAFRGLIESAPRLAFVEESLRSGGIAETFAATTTRPVRIRAIEEGFLPHGDLPHLMTHIGMDEDGLVQWLGGNDGNTVAF